MSQSTNNNNNRAKKSGSKKKNASKAQANCTSTASSLCGSSRCCSLTYSVVVTQSIEEVTENSLLKNPVLSDAMHTPAMLFSPRSSGFPVANGYYPAASGSPQRSMPHEPRNPQEEQIVQYMENTYTNPQAWPSGQKSPPRSGPSGQVSHRMFFFGCLWDVVLLSLCLSLSFWVSSCCVLHS